VPNAVEGSEAKVTSKMEHVGNYIATVITEQKKIRAVALMRRAKYSRDLKALRFRLRPYVNRTPKPRDETYYRLKDEYEDLLQKVYTIDNTVSLIDETVANAQVNQLPGQYAQEGAL
jgi:hypothetical protein